MLERGNGNHISPESSVTVNMTFCFPSILESTVISSSLKILYTHNVVEWKGLKHCSYLQLLQQDKCLYIYSYLCIYILYHIDLQGVVKEPASYKDVSRMQSIFFFNFCIFVLWMSSLRMKSTVTLSWLLLCFLPFYCL